MADLTTEQIMALVAPYGNIGDAITAYAQRPQKSSVATDTLTYNTPYALADMLANRNKIGIESANVAEALKRQENPWYATLKALGQVQGSSEPGKWLESGLRGLATGGTILDDIKIANAQAKYENSLKDLETILKYDKEMGSAQTQHQNQIIGYKEMPYGGIGGKGKGNSQTPEEKARSVATTENVAMTLGDLYRTIDANPQAFSATGGIKQDATSMGLKSGVDVMGVDAIGKREFQYLKDLMPNGFATTINSARENEIMRPYTQKFHNGRGSEKKATIKGMLGSIYDAYAADAAAQGFQMPISKEQYIQSRIDAGREINAEWFSKPDMPMYKVNPAVEERKQQQEQTEKNYTKFLEGTI